MARRDINLSDYLPYLVNRVGAALVARFTEESLAPHRLSIAMWRVLAALSHAGAQRQIDVAELTSIDVSTLSRLVTRLVQMGLVTRLPAKNSNREVSVQLSAKGEKLVDQIIPMAHHLEAIAVAGLPATELQAAKRALRRMYRNLTEQTSAQQTRARR
jgi:MarR family transcriptional regulator, organic hydroperoxide resistance regulator